MERFGEAGKKVAGTCDGVGSRNDKCPSLPNVAAFRFVAASCGHLSDLQGLAKGGARPSDRYLWSVPVHVPPLLRQPP